MPVKAEQVARAKKKTLPNRKGFFSDPGVSRLLRSDSNSNLVLEPMAI